MIVLWLLLGCGPDRVADLEARVVTLEAENEALKARAAELEQRLEDRPASAVSDDPPLDIPVAIVDGVYVVRREDLPQLDAPALWRMVRVIPHRDATEEMDGYRLAGIRRGSFPARLGLVNGDVVHSINDIALVSMAAMVTVADELPVTTDWEVGLTRRGADQTLIWRIDENVK